MPNNEHLKHNSCIELFATMSSVGRDSYSGHRIAGAVNAMCCWEDTPQGQTYWNNVYELCAYELDGTDPNDHVSF